MKKPPHKIAKPSSKSLSTPSLRPRACPMSDRELKKKRKKLGYQRVSIACTHCRKRKTRCLLADEDPQGRCESCIRLEKECSLSPTEQHNVHESRSERGSRRDTESTSLVIPSTSSELQASHVLNRAHTILPPRPSGFPSEEDMQAHPQQVSAFPPDQQKWAWEQPYNGDFAPSSNTSAYWVRTLSVPFDFGQWQLQQPYAQPAAYLLQPGAHLPHETPQYAARQALLQQTPHLAFQSFESPQPTQPMQGAPPQGEKAVPSEYPESWFQKTAGLGISVGTQSETSFGHRHFKAYNACAGSSSVFEQERTSAERLVFRRVQPQLPAACNLKASISAGSRAEHVVPTFNGFVKNSIDCLVLFEACLSQKLHHVPRRPRDDEHSQLIKSGSIFIYEQDASSIKRWTDGVAWSPSRILGNFLIYCELEKPLPPGEKKRTMKRKRVSVPGKPYPRRDSEETGPPEQHQAPITPPTPGGPAEVKPELPRSEQDKEIERSLIGSLVDSYGYRPDRLVKKTMSISVNGMSHHMVSYFKVDDVKNNLLPRPLSDPQLQHLTVRPELLLGQNFRAPIEESGDCVTE